MAPKDSLQILPPLLLPGLAQRKQSKKLISKSFHERGLTTYFINSCPRVWLLICMHLGANCDLPWSLKELRNTSATFSLWLAALVKPGHQHISGRSLHTLSQRLPEDSASNQPAFPFGTLSALGTPQILGVT